MVFVLIALSLCAIVLYPVIRRDFFKPTDYTSRTVTYNGEEFVFEFWADTSCGISLPFFRVKKRLPDKHFFNRNIKMYDELDFGWTTGDRVSKCWRAVEEYYAEIETRNTEAAHVKDFCEGR